MEFQIWPIEKLIFCVRNGRTFGQIAGERSQEVQDAAA